MNGLLEIVVSNCVVALALGKPHQPRARRALSLLTLYAGLELPAMGRRKIGSPARHAYTT